MPNTRSQACSAQPAEQVTSPRASPPRRVLRSRQGNAGVIVNLGEGSTSFIVARGPVPGARYSISLCKDKRCHTCRTFQLEKQVIWNTTQRKYEIINHTGEDLNCHSQNIIYLSKPIIILIPCTSLHILINFRPILSVC